MSMQLYNGSAYRHERVAYAAWGGLNQEEGYEVWQAYNEATPADATYWGCGEGTAMWLREQLGDSFFFPSDGLKGEAKRKLCRDLANLIRQIESGELEYEDPLLDFAAGLGAALGTVPIACSPNKLKQLHELLEFLDWEEEVYCY